jgi:hypothetical protein
VESKIVDLIEVVYRMVVPQGSKSSGRRNEEAEKSLSTSTKLQLDNSKKHCFAVV